MASIEERSSGVRVVWRLKRPGHPSHGRKQPIECHDLETAEKVASVVDAHRGNLTRSELEQMLWGDLSLEDEGITFSELAELWLPSKTRISPRTRDGYQGMLGFRILPAFGGKRVKPFAPADVSGFVNGMRAAGLSNKTITRHYSVINQTFRFGVKNGYLDTNPCDGTDFVWDQIADDDQGDEDHVYLTPDEYQLVHGSVSGSIQDFVEVLVASGVRFNEGTAFQPRDLIPPTRRNPEPQLWVRRAWKLRKGPDGKREWYLGATKGRQRRRNTIDWALWELLLKLSEGRAPDDLIFTGPKGGRLDYDWFEIRWNAGIVHAMRCPRHPPEAQGKQVADATGNCGDNGGLTQKGTACGHKLKPGWNRCSWHIAAPRDAVSNCDCSEVLHRRPTPHDLRHTCVAWMLEDPNVASTYVSRYVGHATNSVTDKVYAGLMPSGQKSAASAIAKARGRATSAAPSRRPRVSSRAPKASADELGAETSPAPRPRQPPVAALSA
ncbi:tyrosine-type recombinase/integrase [Winogradskya humida]|nr:site-specific integrase [Actinoplanes humidus]